MGCLPPLPLLPYDYPPLLARAFPHTSRWMRLPSAVRHALAVLALSRVAQSFATPGTPACSVATSCGASAVSMALRGGMEMPPIMYGTAWKKERTAELVVQAVREGFRGIDTACQPKHYFEPGVGAALRTLEQEG